MGVSKNLLFSDEQNQIAEIAKGLAHPARVKIIEYLLKADTCINNDLVKELGLAQSTISQHLKALKDIGLIEGTIDGVCMNYCINKRYWIEMNKQLIAFLSQEIEKHCCK